MSVITVPVRGRLVPVPVVPLPYANLDAPRAPGGLFVDEAGNFGLAVDARAPAPLLHAMILKGAAEAATILGGLES